MSKTRLRAERCRKRCGRNRKLHKWSSISWNPVRVFFRLKSANSRRYETADKSAVVFTEAASVVPANSLYAKTAAKRGGWEAKSDESARAQPLQVGCVSQLDAKVFETSVRTWRTNVKARWAWPQNHRTLIRRTRSDQMWLPQFFPNYYYYLLFVKLVASGGFWTMNGTSWVLAPVLPSCASTGRFWWVFPNQTVFRINSPASVGERI